MKFELSDNMFQLAEAQLLIETILEKNNFPLEEYKKWLKRKKKV